MRKILVLIIIVSFYSLSWATEGRVKGLGVNPLFYDDDYLITIFPQYLSKYMNNAYIDACGKSHNYSGGLNFKFLGADFGAYINKDFPVVFEYHNVQLDKVMNLYLAKNNFGLGFDIGLSYYNTNEQPPGKSLDELILGFGGKIGCQINNIDMALKMLYTHGISTHENVDEEKDNAFILNFFERNIIYNKKSTTLFTAIEVELMTYDHSLSFPTQSVQKNNSSTDYLFVNSGLGVNHSLHKKIFVVLAGTFGVFTTKHTESSPDNMTKNTDEDKWTRVIFPKIELGLEALPTKWLALRAGINKQYYYDVLKNYAGSTDLELLCLNSDFSCSFGIGLQFGKYSIDWQISDDLLWNGPYIISGKNSNFASSLSMKFCFN